VARRNNFIERSMMGAVSFLKESAFSDELASKTGFLQTLDPRIKAVTFLFFVLAVLMAKNIFTPICLYGLCLILAGFSKIDMGFFLRRTWVFIPLFSLFIAVPAMFSVFTPGQPIADLNILGLRLVMTRQGLSGAFLFVARVITSVSFAVLLSITTKHFELLKVLRTFGLPQVFVMILGMCYRYIYLFMEIIENTYRAIKSRVGTRIHYKKGQRIVAWNMASLWHRSYQLNEAVYGAMLSRGYAGEPVVSHDFKCRPKDWIWFIFSAMVSFFLVYTSRNA